MGGPDMAPHTGQARGATPPSDSPGQRSSRPGGPGALLDVIRSMYRYNEWANRRILDTSAGLTPAQLLEGGGASFDSIRDTLVHTMGAQWLYLERWHGRAPRAMPDAAAFPDLAVIRARWDEIERDTQAFVLAIDDTRLAAPLSYVNMQGETWTYPLWQQMIHQV